MAWKALRYFFLLLNSMLPALAKSHVFELTPETFDSYICEHETVLVQFGSPWSAHCRRLTPAFEKAAGFLKDYNIHLATIDCPTYYDMCERHGITSYPMMRIYDGDPEDFRPYEGGRAVEDIIKYMSGQTCPPEICPRTTAKKPRPPTRPTPTPLPNPYPNSTAPNAVWISDNHTEALVKLQLPGLETLSPPTDNPTRPLSVLLNFAISPNSHHLLLNSRPLALTIPSPSRPQRLEAARVLTDFDITDTNKLRLGDLDYVRTEAGHLLTGLDYSLSARNRDDPGIRYYIYHPELYLEIIGAGLPGLQVQTTLMDSAEQKWLKINLRETNRVPSDDPNRSFVIDSISIEDRAQNHKAPRPDDKTCSLWSWRCADTADPPWYQFVWRANFDEFGRIGCLRRALLMRKAEVEMVLPVPWWVVGVLAVGGLGWRVRGRCRRRGKEGLPVKVGEVVKERK
ncbi:protein disulfide-isomerase precursor [Saxophila tyrrhenica]|uniref:Protein disulfide-isomerase n=1 Tax=Saxophila tyrrhenica TaxID=1690608 RepID=A0AAV9P4A2_9PEZI|nr:protein disulfide-isomerase precursor [Saxophila tyrrhenica]